MCVAVAELEYAYGLEPYPLWVVGSTPTRDIADTNRLCYHGFMVKRHVTIDDLAVMVKRGFDQTATKEELRGIRNEMQEFRKDVIDEFEKINADIHDINITLGPLVRMVAAMELELKSHSMRIERLERKLGLGK